MWTDALMSLCGLVEDSSRGLNRLDSHLYTAGRTSYFLPADEDQKCVNTKERKQNHLLKNFNNHSQTAILNGSKKTQVKK